MQLERPHPSHLQSRRRHTRYRMSLDESCRNLRQCPDIRDTFTAAATHATERYLRASTTLPSWVVPARPHLLRSVSVAQWRRCRHCGLRRFVHLLIEGRRRRWPTVRTWVASRQATKGMCQPVSTTLAPVQSEGPVSRGAATTNVITPLGTQSPPKSTDPPPQPLTRRWPPTRVTAASCPEALSLRDGTETQIAEVAGE